jgi:hypothetical protein
MRNRILGTEEVVRRVTVVKDALGLKACMLTPTKPVNEEYLPCIFIQESVDEVTKTSARTRVGYPMKRSLELNIEIVADRNATKPIYDLYREVRSAVFADDNPVVADGGTFIQEIRTEGPTGYGLPDVVGMTLVLTLFYTDEGN